MTTVKLTHMWQQHQYMWLHQQYMVERDEYLYMGLKICHFLLMIVSRHLSWSLRKDIQLIIDLIILIILIILIFQFFLIILDISKIIIILIILIILIIYLVLLILIILFSLSLSLKHVFPLRRSVINWQKSFTTLPHVSNSISCLGWN